MGMKTVNKMGIKSRGNGNNNSRGNRNKKKVDEMGIKTVEEMGIDKMGSYRLYKEVNKKYTGCNLKTSEFLDCALRDMCLKLNMVCPNSYC